MPPSRTSTAGLAAALISLGTALPLLQPLGVQAATPAAAETLGDSQRRLQAFPFQPNCEGNTQEIVACHWRQRNLTDERLLRLLGSAVLLEDWRRSRQRVCERVGCENALNETLLRQLDGTHRPGAMGAPRIGSPYSR